MHIQTITTEAGEELVILSRRAFDALMARAGDEDAEDRMTLIIAAEARGAVPLPEPVSAAVLRGDSHSPLARHDADKARQPRGDSTAELSS